MEAEMAVGEGGTQSGRGGWENGIRYRKLWGCQFSEHEHGGSGSDGGQGQGSIHANRGWPTRHGSRGARVPPRAALEGVKGGKGNRWGRYGFHGKQTWMVLGCMGEDG